MHHKIKDLAEQTLADHYLFAIDAPQWKKFQAALNRPVKRKSRLAKLLNSKGVFD